MRGKAHRPQFYLASICTRGDKQLKLESASRKLLDRSAWARELVGWKDVLCDRSVEERRKGTRLASFTPRRLSRRTYLPWCCGLAWRSSRTHCLPFSRLFSSRLGGRSWNSSWRPSLLGFDDSREREGGLIKLPLYLRNEALKYYFYQSFW